MSLGSNPPQCVSYGAYPFLTLADDWVPWLYPHGLHLLGTLFTFSLCTRGCFFFLDCKAPLKCLAMVLKLGGRLNLDGCVEQAL